MPTGKDTLNGPGLMMAARQSCDAQARVVSALEAFRSKIANSEEFARRLDEAIMRQNHRAIITLAEEVGLPREAEVKILRTRHRSENRPRDLHFWSLREDLPRVLK